MKLLTQIYQYPVKSSMPISLQESPVHNRGLAFDRLWAIFDKNGQALTAREYPNLLDIEAKVTGEELLIRYKETTVCKVPLAVNSEESKSVSIFSYSATAALTDQSANSWFSDFLGVECQLLVHDESKPRDVLEEHGGTPGDNVGFADQCPILLTTEESLADLNARLKRPLLMNRFRPNLVVKGTQAWEEDQWQRVAIGECEFKVNQACIRCALTTIDPISKAKDPESEPLRTLNTFRKGPVGGVVFGMHLTPVTLGAVNVNDEVVVLK